MALVQRSYSPRMWEMEDVIENLTHAFISQRKNPALGRLRNRSKVTRLRRVHAVTCVSVSHIVEISPLLRSRNLDREDRLFSKTPLLSRGWVGTDLGSRTSCHDHFLKLQGHFLPTFEFHTLQTNNSQESDAQACFFIFIDSCVANMGAALNQPESGGQGRGPSVYPLLKCYLPRGTCTATIRPGWVSQTRQVCGEREGSSANPPFATLLK